MFYPGLEMFMVRERSCQELVMRMRKIVIPVQAFIPLVNFIAVGCNQVGFKIQFFSQP